jgi:hypothetical protein
VLTVLAVLAVVVPELLLELPHAASSSESAATSAAAATVLIDLIKTPPVCLSVPSSGVSRVQGVPQPVAQKIEGKHREQQR